jgi:hypothetical protein
LPEQNRLVESEQRGGDVGSKAMSSGDQGMSLMAGASLGFTVGRALFKKPILGLIGGVLVAYIINNYLIGGE